MASGTIRHAAPENINTLIKLVYYTYKWTTSLAADASLTITADNFGISTPSGYTPMGITRFTSGTNTCVVDRVNPRATGTIAALVIRNKSSSAQTGKTAGIGIMYVRNNFIN